MPKLISKGFIYYGTGGALGFDTLAALAVLESRKTYPQIKLILVLPCKNQTKYWNEKDIKTYNYIKSHADKIVYTSQNYYNGCMQKRNRHLIGNSSLCICFLKSPHSGTAQTVTYAKNQRLKIINIAKIQNSSCFIK